VACAETPSLPPTDLTLVAKLPSERMFGKGASRVRVLARDASGAKTRVAGATCRLSSKELRGQVVSPGVVRYPTFIQAKRFPERGRPGALEVTCTAGEKSGRVVVAPTVPSSRGGPGLLTTTQTASGPVTTQTVGFGGALRSTYPWVYPTTIEVEIK
jgi:hypothetical protein